MGQGSIDGCKAGHHQQHRVEVHQGRSMDALDSEDGPDTSPENPKAKKLDKSVARFPIPRMEKTASCDWNSPRVYIASTSQLRGLPASLAKLFSCNHFGYAVPALTLRIGKEIQELGQQGNMLGSSEEGLVCILFHLCHQLHVIGRLQHLVSKDRLD